MHRIIRIFFISNKFVCFSILDGFQMDFQMVCIFVCSSILKVMFFKVTLSFLNNSGLSLKVEYLSDHEKPVALVIV